MVLGQAFVAFGFVERVEVSALEVFDEGEGEQGLVVDVANNGGDCGPAECGGGAEAAFTGDEFEAGA
ncbi:MAG: hypothetical protein MUE41_03105 [Gemmatimonadaceae bacterium]|nr:hypothetical protein [Gemmatimonadaceae bacterium]